GGPAALGLEARAARPTPSEIARLGRGELERSRTRTAETRAGFARETRGRLRSLRASRVRGARATRARSERELGRRSGERCEGRIALGEGGRRCGAGVRFEGERGARRCEL